MKPPSDPPRSGGPRPAAASSHVRLTKRWRRFLVVVLVLVAGIALTAVFGSHLIVSPDPLPDHADAAIVLAGSDEANIARFDEGMRLMRQGRVDHVVYRVAPLLVWGEWQPDVVRRFIDRTYGDGVASRIIICEGLADSTLEEARLIHYCLRGRGFRSMIVVTSNYHTRRAKLIWRAVLARRPPEVSLAVHGVFDGGFEATGWWQHRRYAKTWLLETFKLAWALLESLAPSSQASP